MKKYYAVIENSPGTKDKFLLVGYQERKKPVIRYFESISKEEPKKYKLVKIQKKKLEKIPEYYEYYLVRFGPTFIPMKYYQLAKDSIETEYCDLRYASDVLNRIYRTEKTNEKDKKALERVIILVELMIDELKESATNPQMLKELEQLFEQYRNETYFDKNFQNYEEIPFV